jgi:hypothetical protein
MGAALDGAVEEPRCVLVLVIESCAVNEYNVKLSAIWCNLISLVKWFFFNSVCCTTHCLARHRYPTIERHCLLWCLARQCVVQQTELKKKHLTKLIRLHHIALSLTLYWLTARLSITRTNTQHGSSTAPSSAAPIYTQWNKRGGTSPTLRHTPCATDTNHHTCQRQYLTHKKTLPLGKTDPPRAGLHLLRSIIQQHSSLPCTTGFPPCCPRTLVYY